MIATMQLWTVTKINLKEKTHANGIFSRFSFVKEVEEQFKIIY